MGNAAGGRWAVRRGRGFWEGRGRMCWVVVWCSVACGDGGMNGGWIWVEGLSLVV